MPAPLPFLDEKKGSSVSGEVTMGDNLGLEAAAHDILQAIEAKDHRALAQALKNAIELCPKDEPSPDSPPDTL